MIGIESTVDRMLTYLGLSEYDDCISPMTRLLNLGVKIPLSYFDGAEPIYQTLGDRNPLVKSHRRSWIGLDEDGRLSETNASFPQDDAVELSRVNLGTWKTVTIFDPHGPLLDQDWMEENFQKKKAVVLYQLRRSSKVDPREIRNSGIRMVTGDLQDDAAAVVFNDGSYRVDRCIYERRGVDFWLVGIPHPIRPIKMVDDDNFCLPCMTASPSSLWLMRSAALTASYEWHILLGWQQVGCAPRIRFPIDPMSLKENFKKREVPPGKTRRQAIRHWVCEHWRKGATDIDPETHIWPYLRGSTKFEYCGLQCEVEPSVFDLKKAAEFQQMRKIIK